MTSILSVAKPPDYPPDDPPALKYYICEVKKTLDSLTFGVYFVKGM